ncbi:MAG: hypothetical protein FWG08_04875 [Propionibacteriaceae bacterium]|nr:hypothetical protein [Propionibacteriaceae bacterium]
MFEHIGSQSAQEEIIDQCVRVLGDDGSICWQVGNFVDVGIEILPTKSLQSEMSSGPAYYEGELDNVVRQGRGVPSVPLVIMGIEPD